MLLITDKIKHYFSNNVKRNEKWPMQNLIFFVKGEGGLQNPTFVIFLPQMAEKQH